MRKIAYLLLTVAIFVSVNAFAQEQEQKTPTPEEMAAKFCKNLFYFLFHTFRRFELQI